MGFKRTSEGRVFFQSGGSNDSGQGKANGNTAMAQDNAPPAHASAAVPPLSPAASGSNPTQMQILALLKSLNERLHATQSEREYLRGELETYKGLVQDLRHKAENQEKASQRLEKRLNESSEAAKKAGVAEKLREETFRELEETRRALAELEEKADKTEHEIKMQMAQIRQGEMAIKKKQAEFENLQAVRQADIIERINSRQKEIMVSQNKKWEELLTQMEKRERSLENRITKAETTALSYDEKIEEALNNASKLDRKLDKAMQDRLRFIRKLERIEETVIQTHDALNSQAMVLLTDRNLASQTAYPHRPAILPGEAQAEALSPEMQGEYAPPHAAAQDLPWWKRPQALNGAGMTAMVLVALTVGFLASNIQKPEWASLSMPALDMPDLAMPSLPENEAAAFLAGDEAPAAGQETQNETAQTAPWEEPAEPETKAEPAFEDGAGQGELYDSEAVADLETAEAETDALLNSFIENNLDETDDIGAQALTEKEKILAALEDNPDRVAERLNEIEPGALSVGEQELRIASISPDEPAAGNEVAEPAEPQQQAPQNTFDPTLKNRIKSDSNLPSAVADIETEAFAGDAEAQHDLAAFYTAGRAGVRQDYGRAAAWFREAAENGVSNAAYNLGVLHHQGIGVKQDLGEAIAWYSKAAGQGHPEAQYNLGIAYIEGIGLPYDPQKAAVNFEGAAKSGVMEAAYNLGLIYENGLLGKAQPEEALLWYKEASDKGSPEAKAALEQLAKTLDIKMDDINRIVESIKSKKEANLGGQGGTKLADSGASYPALVSQIQQELMNLGLYPGPADGVDGPLTADAIRSYQSAYNLSANGKPTQKLLDHMRQQNTNSAVQ